MDLDDFSLNDLTGYDKGHKDHEAFVTANPFSAKSNVSDFQRDSVTCFSRIGVILLPCWFDTRRFGFVAMSSTHRCVCRGFVNKFAAHQWL
jgi:hypothetical protein